MLRKSLSLPMAVGLCLLATATASAQAPPVPFPCTGTEVYLIMYENAELYTLDLTQPPGSALTRIGGPYGEEINNIGFNRLDGLLYGYQISPPRQLVKIDATGNIVKQWRPMGLPLDRLKNAGDVSLDGTKFYINTSGKYDVCTVDLVGDWVGPCMPLLCDAGMVRDWAINPIDGMLYGGDDQDGELIRLDPMTGVRHVCDNSCPDATSHGYGAAWFDAAGHLYVYDNCGVITEIDDPAGKAAVVNTWTGFPDIEYNDAASCVQDILGVAKHMTATAGGPPNTVTIDFVIENISGRRMPSAPFHLSNLTAQEDLALVFGTPGIDWTFTSIVSTPPAFANGAFDGFTDTELVNHMTPQSLPTGATATITVTLQLLTHTYKGLDGFCNQTVVWGNTAGGALIGDHSTAGLLPDPNHDGSPQERRMTCVMGPICI